MPERPGPLQHLVGAFVLFHVVAISLMAAPAPSGGMARSAWQDGTVQAEFRAWTERLNSFGVDITTAQLEERLWDVASVVMKQRKAVLDPLMPYYKYCGTWQSWRMFVAPHRFPSRLSIQTSTDADRRGATWAPLYEGRHETLDWHAKQLDHDRMRAAVFRYGWKHYRGSYKEFGTWVARQVASERPDVRWVRLQLYKYETPSPEQVREDRRPEGRFHSVLHLDLREHR
jgi:hypothetical protein